MKPEQARVVVVGGGPAGLSAALNAALSGASVLLIDSSSALVVNIGATSLKLGVTNQSYI